MSCNQGGGALAQDMTMSGACLPMDFSLQCSVHVSGAARDPMDRTRSMRIEAAAQDVRIGAAVLPQAAIAGIG